MCIAAAEEPRQRIFLFVRRGLRVELLMVPCNRLRKTHYCNEWTSFTKFLLSCDDSLKVSLLDQEIDYFNIVIIVVS
jgi:hypothetical protein